MWFHNVTTGSKQTSIFLPLSQIFGYCKDNQTVFWVVKYTLVLDRADPNSYIMKINAAAAGKFNISHISLWMPKVQLNLDIQTDLERLVSGHIKNLYFEQIRIYRTCFEAAITSPTWRITTQDGSQLPWHVFIALQSTERSPNANPQNVNNMVFDHGNLTRISVKINSTQYPERELETNFTLANKNYARAYTMF